MLPLHSCTKLLVCSIAGCCPNMFWGLRSCLDQTEVLKGVCVSIFKVQMLKVCGCVSVHVVNKVEEWSSKQLYEVANQISVAKYSSTIWDPVAKQLQNYNQCYSLTFPSDLGNHGEATLRICYTICWILRLMSVSSPKWKLLRLSVSPVWLTSDLIIFILQ